MPLSGRAAVPSTPPPLLEVGDGGPRLVGVRAETPQLLPGVLQQLHERHRRPGVCGRPVPVGRGEVGAVLRRDAVGQPSGAVQHQTERDGQLGTQGRAQLHVYIADRFFEHEGAGGVGLPVEPSGLRACDLLEFGVEPVERGSQPLGVTGCRRDVRPRAEEPVQIRQRLVPHRQMANSVQLDTQGDLGAQLKGVFETECDEPFAEQPVQRRHGLGLATLGKAGAGAFTSHLDGPALEVHRPVTEEPATRLDPEQLLPAHTVRRPGPLPPCGGPEEPMVSFFNA